MVIFPYLIMYLCRGVGGSKKAKTPLRIIKLVPNYADQRNQLGLRITFFTYFILPQSKIVQIRIDTHKDLQT